MNGCGGSLSGSTYTTGAITTDCTVTATFKVAPTPIHGTCGSAITSGPFTIAPAANLCATGTASAVDESVSAYTWTCLGESGGTNSGQCSATRGYTVTPSAGPNGSITPNTPQTVAYGGILEFTVSANRDNIYVVDYVIDKVSGCDGRMYAAELYITGPIKADCTVEATFKKYTSAPACGPAQGHPTHDLPLTGYCNVGVVKQVPTTSLEQFTWVCGNTGIDTREVQCSAPRAYLVTPIAGTGGRIDPPAPQLVAANGQLNFTVTPELAFETVGVEGCWGALQGAEFSTGPITADCSVEAVFRQASQPTCETIMQEGSASQRCSNAIDRVCTADADCVGAGPDSDGDGRPDAVERGLDSDRDGIPDERDTDDDGDGFDSRIENQVRGGRFAGRLGDVDGNGVADALDPNVVSTERVSLTARRVGNTEVDRLISNVEYYYGVGLIQKLPIPVGQFTFTAKTTSFQLWLPASTQFSSYLMSVPGGSRLIPFTQKIYDDPSMAEVSFDTQPSYDKDPGDAYLLGWNGPIVGTTGTEPTTVTITGTSPSPGVRGRPVTVRYSVAPYSDPNTIVRVTAFENWDTFECIGTVAAGQCDITFTKAGDYFVFARFLGDYYYAPQDSAPVRIPVKALPGPPPDDVPGTLVVHPFDGNVITVDPSNAVLPEHLIIDSDTTLILPSDTPTQCSSQITINNGALLSITSALGDFGGKSSLYCPPSSPSDLNAPSNLTAINISSSVQSSISSAIGSFLVSNVETNCQMNFNSINSQCSNITYIGPFAIVGGNQSKMDANSPSALRQARALAVEPPQPALSITSGEAKIVNSTFANSEALNGAPSLRVTGGTVHVVNSTFSGASPAGEVEKIGGSLTLTNSILNNPNRTCSGQVFDGGGNLDRRTDCGFGADFGSRSGLDPLLGPLTDVNGTAAFPLLAGSPAIDQAIGPVCWDAGLTNGVDARGVARSQGAGCDIGAFESTDLPANDSDIDGVDSSLEGQVPNATGAGFGDGNGDGLPDAQQAEVVSLPAVAHGYFTLSGDGWRLLSARAQAAPATGPVLWPMGHLAFQAEKTPPLQPGTRATFILRIPASVATNGYWQQHRLTGDWTNLAEGVTTEGGQTLIRFSLEDGGPFDLDGAANGRLSALGGPGQDYVNPAPIPTLHPLVLAFLALMLAGSGWRMRQRFRGPQV